MDEGSNRKGWVNACAPSGYTACIPTSASTLSRNTPHLITYFQVCLPVPVPLKIPLCGTLFFCHDARHEEPL